MRRELKLEKEIIPGRVVSSRAMIQPEVTIEQGTLRGSLGVTIRGTKFYKFQGIPYARPPVGEFRFKAPVTPEKWSGIFDATKEGDGCYSRNPVKNKIEGSENCLVLNVFTKQLPDGKNTEGRPVLFWIYAGAFVFGRSNERFYGPDFLITEDIVLVTINHRLGILGFLSLEDPSLDVPGNAGFKDQVMALRWVQKNIDKFGGDPNKVTIFGSSSGAAAVHLLMLSPMGRGLFHRAIAQSACALNPWVRGTRGIARIAPAMGLEGADEETVYKELMRKPVEEIFEIQEKIYDNLTASYLRPFGVVIETNSREPFLAQEPIEIMSSGEFVQVPFMLGYANAEGMIYRFCGPKYTFENAIPWFFGYQKGSTESKAVVEKIKRFYSSSSDLTKEFNLASDCNFIYGIHVSARIHSKISETPVYLYRMALESDLNIFKNFLKISGPGACHCDEIGYLFKKDGTPVMKSKSTEELYVKRFVKLWTNFAKFGNPTPDSNDPLLKTTWKPVTTSNLELLDIGKNLVPMSGPESERVKFWMRLFSESPARHEIVGINCLAGAKL